METISEVLKQCGLGDFVTDGAHWWKIVDLNYDGDIIVARPYKWKKAFGMPFEIWDIGVESLAVIPGLRRIPKKKGRKAGDKSG